LADFLLEADAAMNKLFHYSLVLNRKSLEYCSGVFLYPSEVQTLVWIANSSATNLSDVAHNMQLTKGAISKMVLKLDEMGLLRRYKYLHNQKEVYLHLTELGVRAYEGYMSQRRELLERMDASARAMSTEQKEAVLTFLSNYLKSMEIGNTQASQQ